MKKPIFMNRTLLTVEAVSVEANLREQVKPCSGGRSQNPKLGEGTSGMSQVYQAPVSAKANLREQVKSHSGGRSQNRRLAKGLPA